MFFFIYFILFYFISFLFFSFLFFSFLFFSFLFFSFLFSFQSFIFVSSPFVSLSFFPTKTKPPFVLSSVLPRNKRPSSTNIQYHKKEAPFVTYETPCITNLSNQASIFPLTYNFYIIKCVFNLSKLFLRIPFLGVWVLSSCLFFVFFLNVWCFGGGV